LENLFERTSVHTSMWRFDWTTLIPRYIGYIGDRKSCCFICVAVRCGLWLCVSRTLERCLGTDQAQLAHQVRLLLISLNPQIEINIKAQGTLVSDDSQNASMVQLLLEKGICPNWTTRTGRSVWSEFLKALDIRRKGARHLKGSFDFEACCLMIRHGADRWQRSRSASEFFAFWVGEDAMITLERVFPLSQAALLKAEFDVFKKGSAASMAMAKPKQSGSEDFREQERSRQDMNGGLKRSGSLPGLSQQKRLKF